MKYIKMEDLIPGTFIGKGMYSESGVLLLSSNSTITKKKITSFIEQGHMGVFVERADSQLISDVKTIPENILKQVKSSVKTLFTCESKYSNLRKDKIERNVWSVMNEILSNKDNLFYLSSLKNHDGHTYDHSVNVAILTGIIASTIGFEDSLLRDTVTAALFHDVGKKFIDIETLNKKEKLSEVEMNTIKTHSKLGSEYLKEQLKVSTNVYLGILQHHEKFNGSGYPHGKKNKDISLVARVICVADVYDALTSNRAYHSAHAPNEAIEYIMANSGSLFDPYVVDVFLKRIAVYPIGSSIFLSNGQKAIVVQNFEGFCLRPLVRVDLTGELINLRDDRNSLNLTVKIIA